MWFLALLYGASRPKGTEAGRGLAVAVFLLIWVVAAALQLLGLHP